MEQLMLKLNEVDDLIKVYRKRIEECDEPDGKRAYRLLLKSKLSEKSSLLDSIIQKANLEKADTSYEERELSLILNTEQYGN